MADKVYTSRRGSVFIQKTGANSQPLVLRCLDADTLSSPKRSKELIKCWNPYGEDWIEVGRTFSAPGPSTVTLTQLTETTLSELEKIYCPVTLLFAQIGSGKVTEINNAERVLIMKNAEPTDDNYDNLVHHVDDNASTHAVPFSGDSDIVVVGYPTIQRMPTTETESLNDIHGNLIANCDDRQEPGDLLVAVADADTYADANIIYSRDGGATWETTVDQPFANDENIVAVQWFMVDTETERWLVAKEAPVAGQGEIAYTDDLGDTWISINIGGIAAGHGATMGGTLHVIDTTSIWLASALGYIYKSEDSGETWTAMEQGVIDTENYNHIHFYDADIGVAVGNAGVVALTQDGGSTWYAGTAVTGVPNLLSCWMSEADTIWVGDVAGDLWFSHDFGTTWTERTGLTGAPTQIRDIEFFDSQVALLAADDATPEGAIHQTILGGYSWRSIATPPNSGINAIHIVNQNLAYLVGETNAATAFIARLSA